MLSSVRQHVQPCAGNGAWPVARPAFSIPEVLIVLFIVSLLTYVAVPHIEIVRFRMDGSARGAMAALVSAQRLAVKRQHNVVVSFDTTHHRILIHQDRDNDGTRDDGEPIRTLPVGENVVFGFGSAPAIGGDTRAVTFTETQASLPAVRFIRNGSASEEGGFYLTSTRSLRGEVYAKDSRVVRLDRSTGRVTWYGYEAPDWVEQF